MKKNIRFIILLCLGLALLLSAASAGAEPLPQIADEANLLSDAEEKALYDAMLPLCEYGTPLFWSTNASGSYSTMATRYFYERYGNEDGLLFVINMNVRQLTLVTGGHISRVITQADTNTITDNVYRLARKGDYAGCATEAFRESLKLLQGEKIARPMKLISNVLIALTLALMIVYLYIRQRYENRPKTGKINAALPVTAGKAAAFSALLTAGNARMTKQTRVDISSSSHGGGRGGFSGGGGGFSGGGGGFSGGSGSHGF